MLMRCPKCDSIDVHSSRAKGAKDIALRFVGIAPRRCSACGWRGYRPRFLFPAKQRAGPATAPISAPAIDVRAEEERERILRRRRRKRTHSRRKRTRAVMALAYALALGAGTGLAVYLLSGE